MGTLDGRDRVMKPAHSFGPISVEEIHDPNGFEFTPDVQGPVWLSIHDAGRLAAWMMDRGALPGLVAQRGKEAQATIEAQRCEIERLRALLTAIAVLAKPMGHE
jgi:hypothetical protein